MRISDCFSNVYFKANDFELPLRMTIEEVVFAEFKGGKKPAVKFVGEDRQLVLNKTNGFILSTAFGDETDHWIGREIQLSAIDVMFDGRIVRSISVAIPKPMKRDVLQPNMPASKPVVDAPCDTAKGRTKTPQSPKAQRAIQGASPAPDGPHENSNIQAPEIDFE
jgi:hypothetical protein